ncbi:MAG TPA: hypothetical protein VF285_06710 [Castellaniella sp.]|uniref:hypothetical protein n=1 Tax=Castellaniella sp. TaxID=1955812 RepID=UPI002F03C39D
MTALRWLTVALAVLLLQPAYADTGPAQGAFGVRLVITSQCTTQYSLFGPQAMGPVSVICSPGNTPFMTFSSIINNVAVGSSHPGTPANITNTEEQPGKREPGEPDQVPFLINASQFSPLASKATAISGLKTRIVHVTF